MVSRLLKCISRIFVRTKPFYRQEIFKSLSKVGADSIPIVSIIAACTGIILALQSAQQLEKVGAISYVANLVGVTILMELGPLLTAIIIAGRSGAAFAAEIAAMQISEEIDALEVMGLEPVQYLVWPKFLAMLVMVPCLTVLADFVGICAGGLFSSGFLGINGHLYSSKASVFCKPASSSPAWSKAWGLVSPLRLSVAGRGFSPARARQMSAR